jgi:hypothetical protein
MHCCWLTAASRDGCLVHRAAEARKLARNAAKDVYAAASIEQNARESGGLGDDVARDAMEPVVGSRDDRARCRESRPVSCRSRRRCWPCSRRACRTHLHFASFALVSLPEVFHLQDRAHAGRTSERPRKRECPEYCVGGFDVVQTSYACGCVEDLPPGECALPGAQTGTTALTPGNGITDSSVQAYATNSSEPIRS